MSVTRRTTAPRTRPTAAGSTGSPAPGSSPARSQGGPASASGSHRQETELTARVLGWPFGQALVGLVGAVLVAAGLGFGYQALTTNFEDRLERRRMRPAVWWAVKVLGAVGSWARAAVLGLVGVFVVSAALTFQP